MHEVTRGVQQSRRIPLHFYVCHFTNFNVDNYKPDLYYHASLDQWCQGPGHCGHWPLALDTYLGWSNIIDSSTTGEFRLSHCLVLAQVTPHENVISDYFDSICVGFTRF